MDSTVLPPGTYVKVSGNLRSFQVSVLQGLPTFIFILFSSCGPNTVNKGPRFRATQIGNFCLLSVIA